MSPHTESILTKQIKGLTWGVVISFFCGIVPVGVFMIHHLIRIEIVLAKADGYGDQIKAMSTRIDVVDKRVDNQESRFFELASQIKDKTK